MFTTYPRGKGPGDYRKPRFYPTTSSLSPANKELILGAPTISWVDYGSLQKEIDIADFGGGIFTFSVNLLTSVAGIPARARLYNITDSEEVAGSRVETTSTSMVQLTSAPISLSGSKDYKVQIGNSGGLSSDTVEGQWHEIMVPTGSNDAARIQAVIDAGARKILLLDGSWDVSDQQVTFATGTEIYGQTREGTILSWGTVNYWLFLLAANCIAANFTVNTAPTDGFSPPIFTVDQSLAWNIHFGTSSGNGAQGDGGIIAECFFEGVPDATTGQIMINKPKRLIIRNCEFGGAAASGSAIHNQHVDQGPEVLPAPTILITGCYGFTECADGWVDDSAAGRSSLLSIVDNIIEQKGAAKAVDISLATAAITGNFFSVKAGQTTGASMINVSGGRVMIMNNRLLPQTTRTDIIDIGASSGNVITGNLIDGEATNAIHLAGSGDKNIVSTNNCEGETITIDSSSTGNVIALNRAQTITGSTTDNQIGLNITGA